MSTALPPECRQSHRYAAQMFQSGSSGSQTCPNTQSTAVDTHTHNTGVLTSEFPRCLLLFSTNIYSLELLYEIACKQKHGFLRWHRKSTVKKEKRPRFSNDRS